jgi:hypothetical protein
MRVGGVVSTQDLDRQQEVVVQDGLDFSPFLAHGWFNDNHGQKTVDVLGYPTAAYQVTKGAMLPNGRRADKKGWWTEGYLLNTDEGRRVYDLCAALQKTGGERRLGFSIEGKVLRRDKDDNSRIVAAEVRNVAITHCPVNTSTEMIALAKALSAGHTVGSEAGATDSGFALRTESLDGSQYDQKKTPKKRKKKKKAIAEEFGLSFLSAVPSEDGGQPNQGGVAGKNPHLTKGDNSARVRATPEVMTTIDYAHHWADAMAEFSKEPVEMEMTKSEARLIVGSMKPQLSAEQVELIVDRASHSGR